MSQAPSPQTAAADRIRSFWDDRAARFGTSQRATLGETYLRHVEIRQMLKRLQRLAPGRVLDVGCGNGYSTLQYAAALPKTHFVGVDFSPQMVRLAQDTATANTEFHQADVTDPASLPEGRFDVIYTQRCIQNLPDYETQRPAIQHLIDKLNPGGTLILNECSRDGVEQLNTLRQRLKLKPIDGIEPWHNCFMRDQRLKENFGAEVHFISSTYMFLAKILHKRLAKFARFLPAVGRFGYDRFYVIGSRMPGVPGATVGASPPRRPVAHAAPQRETARRAA